MNGRGAHRKSYASTRLLKAPALHLCFPPELQREHGQLAPGWSIGQMDIERPRAGLGLEALAEAQNMVPVREEVRAPHLAVQSIQPKDAAGPPVQVHV